MKAFSQLSITVSTIRRTDESCLTQVMNRIPNASDKIFEFFGKIKRIFNQLRYSLSGREYFMLFRADVPDFR